MNANTMKNLKIFRNQSLWNRAMWNTLAYHSVIIAQNYAKGKIDHKTCVQNLQPVRDFQNRIYSGNFRKE